MKYRFIDWQEFEAPGATDGEAVGVLTLNRPDRKNALGPRMAIGTRHHLRRNTPQTSARRGYHWRGGDLLFRR